MQRVSSESGTVIGGLGMQIISHGNGSTCPPLKWHCAGQLTLFPSCSHLYKCKLLWLHDEQGKQAGCHTFICNFPHNCLLSGLRWHILDEEIVSIVVHGTLQNALDLLLHEEFVRMQAQADTTTHDH
jgi:hypothetical protein